MLRNASPKLDDSANDLNRPPRTDGSSYGLAPTATDDPDDGEHHEVGAVLPPDAHRRANSARTGMAKLTAEQPRFCVYGTLPSVQ